MASLRSLSRREPSAGEGMARESANEQALRVALNEGEEAPPPRRPSAVGIRRHDAAIRIETSARQLAARKRVRQLRIDTGKEVS